MPVTEHTNPSTPPHAYHPSVEAALGAYRCIARTLWGATAPDWIQLKLSIGQRKTLMTLSARESLQDSVSVSRLADLLQIGRPAASILLDGLLQQGYVARSEDPADRRHALLALTSSGNELVMRLRQGTGSQCFGGWLEQMDDDDLSALTCGLQARAAIATRHSVTSRSAGELAPATVARQVST